MSRIGQSNSAGFSKHSFNSSFSNEISYRMREPERGEVVVSLHSERDKEYYLKRIIGLPGERIKISKGKITVYNQKNTSLDNEIAQIKKDIQELKLKKTTERANYFGTHKKYLFIPN